MLIGENFGRTVTNEISKLGEMLGENSKHLQFFSQMRLKVSNHAQKNQKNLSCVFSPYKAQKSISDLIIVSNGEK